MLDCPCKFPNPRQEFVFDTQIPVLLGVLVLSAAFMMKWSRRVLSRGLASVGEAAAFATGTAVQPSTTPVTQEVTTEQLAGRTGTSAPQGRRGRRARRTPSQISTKSLPAYMKEPGEQELVIFRSVTLSFWSSQFILTLVQGPRPRRPACCDCHNASRCRGC